jgi:hypothetical protein
MAFSQEQLVAILLGALTPEERDGAAVYAADQPVDAGATLRFARTTITTPWDGFLGFVDRDPMANWEHSSRYVVISRETGETRSFEARTPPFSEQGAIWRVVYKAASVPEAIVIQPHR